jgi:hypothetical protein
MKPDGDGLDQVRIASPCHADWSNMPGDDRVRFCGQCEKHVYNLSALSRREAEALVLATEERLCVRFYQRRDGTMLTDDCPVGLHAVRRALMVRLSGAMAAMPLLAILFGRFTSRAAAAAPGRTAVDPPGVPPTMGVPAVPYVRPSTPAHKPQLPVLQTLMGSPMPPAHPHRQAAPRHQTGAVRIGRVLRPGKPKGSAK